MAKVVGWWHELWIDRGLGLVTLLNGAAIGAVTLWIDRGLGLVTLADPDLVRVPHVVD